MSARNKVLTENERADVQRYREVAAELEGPFHFDVSDLPDEAVFSLMAFALWRAGEAWREVGRALWESLPERVRRAASVGRNEQ